MREVATGGVGESDLRGVAVLLEYILSVRDDVDVLALTQALREAGPQISDLAMTVGQQLIEQGFKRGIEQGIERGIAQGIEQGIEQGIAQGIEQGIERERARAVIRVLEKRSLSVTNEQRQRVLSCSDAEVLSRWFDRALTAASAEDALR